MKDAVKDAGEGFFACPQTVQVRTRRCSFMADRSFHCWKYSMK